MFLPSRSRNKLNFFLYICLFFNFKAASSEDSAGFKNDSNNIKVPSMTYVKDHSTMSQIQPTCAMRLWWVTTLQWNLQPEWTGRYQGSETPAWWQMQRCTSIIEWFKTVKSSEICLGIIIWGVCFWIRGKDRRNYQYMFSVCSVFIINTVICWMYTLLCGYLMRK